jgi:hypothetical protein
MGAFQLVTREDWKSDLNIPKTENSDKNYVAFFVPGEFV